MAASIAQKIKDQIAVNLQALKMAGWIKSFQQIDLGKDVLAMAPPDSGYPFAIIGMPIINSDYEDTVTNKRTYRFDVLFVLSYDYLKDQKRGVESVVDAVLNQFDDHFTLEGASDASVLPIEVLAAPISTGDKHLVCFLATIRAQALYTIASTNP